MVYNTSIYICKMTMRAIEPVQQTPRWCTIEIWVIISQIYCISHSFSGNNAIEEIKRRFIHSAIALESKSRNDDDRTKWNVSSLWRDNRFDQIFNIQSNSLQPGQEECDTMHTRLIVPRAMRKRCGMRFVLQIQSENIFHISDSHDLWIGK